MQQGGFPLSVSRFENRETPGLERWQRQDLTSGCALGPPACRLAQPLPSVDKLMGRKRPGGLPGFRDAEHAPPARPPAWSHGVALAHALPELCGAPGRPQGPEKSRETLREGTALPPGHHMLCDRHTPPGVSTARGLLGRESVAQTYSRGGQLGGPRKP